MPQYEPPRFMAAAQFLSSLPPLEAATLLRLRAVQLEAEVASADAVLDGEKWPHYERVHVVELEYARALAAAELGWVRTIVADIEAGTLTSEPVA